MVYSFVYLESIVRRQLLDGIIKLHVGENILRDLINDRGRYTLPRWS